MKPIERTSDSQRKTRRPKILVLGATWPRGEVFGGRLRALHHAQALQQIGDVTFCVVSPDATDEVARRETAQEFNIEPPVRLSPTPNRGLSDRMRWALDPRILNPHGCAASPEDLARIREFLPRYDLVWMLNSRTPNVLQQWNWPGSHLDIDDIPSTYYRSLGQNGPRLRGRIKARVLEHIHRRRERLFADRFASLSVCSEADRAYLAAKTAVHVLPNGFQAPTVAPTRLLSRQLPRIGFIGLYSYLPNYEGMRWFLERCWPLIRAKVPGIHLRLIGKDTDGPDRPTGPDIDALGWVADPAVEIATWSAMIIPILFGGGTRIKVAEAFSRKCPAVSTNFGAFGYDVVDNMHLRLADEPEAFANACVEMVLSPETGSAMAERAWADYLSKWTWSAITPKVIEAAEQCLQRQRPNGTVHRS